MRNSVRKSVKGGIWNDFIKQYKPENSYEVFNILSSELNLSGNICDLVGKCDEFLNKYEKPFSK